MHMVAASWTSTTVMAMMTVGTGLMNLTAVSKRRVVNCSKRMSLVLHWLEKGCHVDSNLIV